MIFTSKYLYNQSKTKIYNMTRRKKTRMKRFTTRCKWVWRKFDISFDSNYLNIDSIEITEKEIHEQLFLRD